MRCEHYGKPLKRRILSRSGKSVGEWFALLAALSFASSNVMVKKGTTPQSSENGAFLSILLTAVISGIFFLGAGLFNGFPDFTSEGMLWFALAGVLTSFIGRILLFNSIQHLGSVRASAIKRLNPFFTVMIGILFLHETLTSFIILGMVLIFGSTVVLVGESLANWRNAKKEIAAAIEPSSPPQRRLVAKDLWKLIASLGYVYGIVSALAYSVGYVVRKQGLTEIPDPFFGTLLGAIVGMLIFGLISLFKEANRRSIISTFTEFKPWLFGAGVATSLGQIFYFIALQYSGVSQVALIASTDVILTIFLSAWVFKTQEGITRTVSLASLVAMTGAGFIALGS